MFEHQFWPRTYCSCILARVFSARYSFCNFYRQDCIPYLSPLHYNYGNNIKRLIFPNFYGNPVTLLIERWIELRQEKMCRMPYVKRSTSNFQVFCLHLHTIYKSWESTFWNWNTRSRVPVSDFWLANLRWCVDCIKYVLKTWSLLWRCGSIKSIYHFERWVKSDRSNDIHWENYQR